MWHSCRFRDCRVVAGGNGGANVSADAGLGVLSRIRVLSTARMPSGVWI
jgi:hypothetical protein